MFCCCIVALTMGCGMGCALAFWKNTTYRLNKLTTTNFVEQPPWLSLNLLNSTSEKGLSVCLFVCNAHCIPPPPRILRQGGLETSGQRLFSLNRKTMRTAFLCGKFLKLPCKRRTNKIFRYLTSLTGSSV